MYDLKLKPKPEIPILKGMYQRTLEHLERTLLEVFCKCETSRDIKKS